MAKKKSKKSATALETLIEAADAAVLGQLVQQLASGAPAVQRQCLEFLQKHVKSPAEVMVAADVETVFALWDELEGDLAELDEYGGGPDETEERVADLLDDLAQKLKQCATPTDDRLALLDELMPYIESGNSGLEDCLYDVAYALCQDDGDWREFAARLESSGRDWPLDHARRIYRKLGDRGKYLALRARRMEYGADYHDLATFHWEQGERDEAMAIAREGLKKAKGRMDELRAFVARRGKSRKTTEK